MPELPEIETVKITLTPNVLNKVIQGVTLTRPNLRYIIPSEITALCKNARIIDITRRAKYLLLHLNNYYTIIIHLGMSGRLQLKSYDYQYLKHDHVIFDLGNQLIVFNDARRFGLIDILPNDTITSHRYFAKLGIEPLTEEFSAEYLHKTLIRKSSPIKLAIMDNEIVVGVGNIYASESLHLAKINPLTPANNLRIEQLKILVESIKFILKQAIEAGGSSLKDYVTATGTTGYFQHHFRIYGKAKQNCLTCQTEIKMIKLGGRATFYCLECQT